MILSAIFAIVSWFIFKKSWLAIIVFYLVMGIKKSRLWLAIPIFYLPPSLQGQNFGTFIYGILCWPGSPPLIIKIISHQYFREVDKGNDRLV